MACWSCERPEGEGPLCQACGTVLPPRTGRTHFEVLGVAPRFDLDPTELERRFKDLQRKLHPDRFARADARARRFAAEHTTALNEAWRLLRDDYRRAEYLLARRGVTPEVEPALLHEMLALSEQLADARHEDRAAEVAQLAEAMRLRRADAMRALGETLAGGLDDGGAPQELPQERIDRAGRQLAAVRYFDRFLANAEGRAEL